MYRGRASNPSGGRGRGRGSWSGLRRGQFGAWRGREQASKAVVDHPLGRLVAKITLNEGSSHNINAEDAKITDCRYAASYSLVDSRLSKIIIPGEPATWKPPQLPSRLRGDYGEYLRDQNSARFPEHPMQPSVQSLFALNGDFDPSSVDIMGCASSLGDLLRFTRSVDSTFRFDVEMVGNTMFLIRNCRDQLIPDVRGYGHSFLDAFTSYQAGVRETKSHQRIVSYSFGGLKCLVRFECDGHFASNDEKVDTEITAAGVSKSPAESSIAVKAAGVAVPQESILEIKTKSQARGLVDMGEHLPRLWLRQIPNLITAYHVGGNFDDVQEKAIRADMLSWETDHMPELRQFASILRQLIFEVKRVSHLKLEVCRTGLGSLELRERNGTPREALPDHWKQMWAGYDQEAGESGRDGEGRLSEEHDDASSSSISSGDDRSDQSEGSGDDFALDYTACDVGCGYCGHCT
ncbi:hypothetical protein GGR54DRAFT_571375 [Hypoxylon sp. NC1633]|nr:hypothetical protein GGR54DRAFT_571375 [Hypoxylon sp. NC1633]